jgi:hypothetical protein
MAPDMEDAALHWATEMDRSGYGEFAFKRLRVMAMEDVGLAAPEVVTQVQALYSTWTDLRKKKDDKQEPWRLALCMAVMVLCRAPKSRCVDHALIAHYLSDEARPIPPFAYDKHTAKGRMAGKGWLDFWQNGTLLADQNGELGFSPAIADVYRERAIQATTGNHRRAPQAPTLEDER